jgi:hypothetical protein
MSAFNTLRKAQTLIWRNLPGFPSTFGPCARGCGCLGRGSGPCIDCAKDDLAALVGGEMAAKYVDAIRGIRELENAMEHHVNRDS